MLLVGVGYFALVLLGFYGLRLRRALAAGLMERHAAQRVTADLRAHQQRLLVLERERTPLLERERLMGDMHDGVGSALVASAAAMQRGDFDREQLTTLLKDCAEDLRSVVASLEPIDSDLVVLLAALRFRLARRLEASGVRLEWGMQDLPKLEWLGPSEALHAMRIMQELLNSVAKHAGASRVLVATAHIAEAVEIRVEDDGCGFEMSRVAPGRGLGFLRQRNAAIGGVLQIHSQPGAGTAVALRLPVQR